MKVRARGAVAAMAAGALLATACSYVHPPMIARVDGPVVTTAADLGLQNLNLNPSRALAFRWDADDADWVQIPVQVDERHEVDFGALPPGNNHQGSVGTVYGTDPIGVTALQYSDPGTWVGADPDATFDADDELVFMARDAGPKAPAGAAPPSGIVGARGKQIRVTDPIDANRGFAYVFYGTNAADSSAGQDLVDYDFSLDGGDYLDDYKRKNGPNPESSSVTTGFYEMGFSDRWFTVDLDLGQGDILDGHKSQFAINFCGRSNRTFANAHGAFATNIDGPVRAIRSYVGANSGPISQRTEIFYDNRYENITDLRVHAIPGVMSFWDMNAAAAGMQYRTSEMAASVAIDGQPDSVPGATPEWIYVHGDQGYVSRTFDLRTSFNPSTAHQYVDDTTPPSAECWGDDGDYFGAGGVHINSSLPNTDPRTGGTDTLVAHEIAAFWPPNVNPDAWTPVWAERATQPLKTAVTNF